MKLISLIAIAFVVQSASVSAQHRLVVQGNEELAIVDEGGGIEWEMAWGGIHDVHVLDSGNIMVQERNQKVVEIDVKAKQVWSYDPTGVRQIWYNLSRR